MKTAFKKILLLSFLVVLFAMPVSVSAASFKNSRPKFDKSCAYLANSIYLKWSKVTGAKSYEIQRAKIDPKTGEIGKWAAWKTSKKTSIKVKGIGDCKYRVRAVKGKEKSKWSAAKRIFSANAKITHVGYTEPDVLFGVVFSEGRLEFRVFVNNKSRSDMGFVKDMPRFRNQHKVYAVNKAGKVVKTWNGYLDLSKDSSSGIAKNVVAKKSQSIYVYANVTSEEWKKYKNCSFMVSSTFYPNPEVEPITTNMAVAYTKSVLDSAIAAK